MTATQTNGLAEATRRIHEASDALTKEDHRHKVETARLESQLEHARRHRDLVLAGVPLGTVEMAEQVISVLNPENAHVGDGLSVIRDAIRALSQGGKTYHDNGNVQRDLSIDYLGTKNYDRWTGQRSDGEYGTAPRHGTTIFAVGLTSEFRRRRGTEATRELTEAEADAAIAYLHAILAKNP